MRSQLAQKVLITKPPKQKLLMDLNVRVTREFALLLRQALPSREKLHKLVRTLMTELPEGSYDQIQALVLDFYKIPFERRTSAQFNATFGIRPYPWLESQFILNFSNCVVAETRLVKAASTFRFYLNLSISPPHEIVDLGMLQSVVRKMTYVEPGAARASYELEDLIKIWMKLCHAKWGDRYRDFFAALMQDVRKLPGTIDSQSLQVGSNFQTDAGHPIELTQTDLEWIAGIAKCHADGQPLPDYPLASGPKSSTCRQLERLVREVQMRPNGPAANAIAGAVAQLCTTYLGLYSKN